MGGVLILILPAPSTVAHVGILVARMVLRAVVSQVLRLLVLMLPAGLVGVERVAGRVLVVARAAVSSTLLSSKAVSSMESMASCLKMVLSVAMVSLRCWWVAAQVSRVPLLLAVAARFAANDMAMTVTTTVIAGHIADR
jgi:hypothetical protein